jgi:xanthine dehydrogenase accessory factor
MHAEILAQLQADRAAKVPVALVTLLASGEQRLLYLAGKRNLGDWPPAIGEAARAALLADRATELDSAIGRLFINIFNPPLRLAIVGAVHIAQALAPMAALAGYDVTIIDPRTAWATEARFAGVRIDTGWPDEALAAFRPDLRTAIVTLTHDPKLDDPALHAALRSDAFYIGSLGSRKTHNARLYRLEKAGFQQHEISRVNGPVGLAIGAKSPAEIAISILAQITQTLRQGGAAKDDA